MRYPPGHKDRARRELVKAGARALKERGFNGIGVDGIAAAAGVTSGALYSNFPNKEALLEAVIDTCLGDLFSATDAPTSARRRARLKALLKDYVNTSHCADPANGCVMPALSADVSRSQPSIKETYDRRITELVQVISGMLEGKRADRERRAWSLVALAVGAVTIARAMTPGGASQHAALRSALTSAMSLVDAKSAHS